MKPFPRLPEPAFAALFALLTVLAYGLLLFRTGFYWDDWPFAWAAHFLGPQSFFDSFLRVRPFLAPIFWLTTTLLPETPLAWQVFALLIRFLLTVSAWWAFRQTWPGQPRATLLAALAFLVYPGYNQHWVALTHINQELIPLLFYLLSLGMTGLALRSETGSRRRTPPRACSCWCWACFRRILPDARTPAPPVSPVHFLRTRTGRARHCPRRPRLAALPGRLVGQCALAVSVLPLRGNYLPPYRRGLEIPASRPESPSDWLAASRLQPTFSFRRGFHPRQSGWVGQLPPRACMPTMM